MASFVRGPAPEDTGRPVLPRAPVPRLAEGKPPPRDTPLHAGLGEGSVAYNAQKGAKIEGGSSPHSRVRLLRAWQAMRACIS